MDVDWALVEVPALSMEPAAEPMQHCVFPTCATVHEGGTAHACNACGQATTRTCVRAHLHPKAVADAFVAHMGSAGWVCPMCAWTKMQAGGAAAAEEAAEEEDGLGALPQLGAGEGLNMEARMTRLEAKVEEQAETIADLQRQLQEADEGLPDDFSPYAVATWRPGIWKGAVRRQIRAEVSRVFREASLPASGTDAGEWMHSLRKCFEHFDDVLKLMKMNTEEEPSLLPLHRIVCEMSALACLTGYVARAYYEHKAKNIPPLTFSASLHQRLVGEANDAQAKANPRRLVPPRV